MFYISMAWGWPYCGLTYVATSSKCNFTYITGVCVTDFICFRITCLIPRTSSQGCSWFSMGTKFYLPSLKKACSFEGVGNYANNYVGWSSQANAYDSLWNLDTRIFWRQKFFSSNLRL